MISCSVVTLNEFTSAPLDGRKTQLLQVIFLTYFTYFTVSVGDYYCSLIFNDVVLLYKTTKYRAKVAIFFVYTHVVLSPGTLYRSKIKSNKISRDVMWNKNSLIAVSPKSPITLRMMK